MPIDIDRLSEEELIDLNHRVVERLRFIRQAYAHRAMLQYRIGERVWFETDTRGRVEGVITRYNRKSVSILSADGHQWRVAPVFLHKLDSEAEETATNLVTQPKR